jgi:polyphosphate kinase
VLFPVDDPMLSTRLREEILGAYLKDNVKARLLQPDGNYLRGPVVGKAFSAQDQLMEIAMAERIDSK